MLNPLTGDHIRRRFCISFTLNAVPAYNKVDTLEVVFCYSRSVRFIYNLPNNGDACDALLSAEYIVGKIVNEPHASAIVANNPQECRPYCKRGRCCTARGDTKGDPEAYFSQKGDPLKNKRKADFVRKRRKVKWEYDEFKVRINVLPESIRRSAKVRKATWMWDGKTWHGMWFSVEEDHSRRDDDTGIIQLMLVPPGPECTYKTEEDPEDLIDTRNVDTRPPMLVYVFRESRRGYDLNKKAGARNALMRLCSIEVVTRSVIFNSYKGLREINPSNRYANHNMELFDVSMRALDGLHRVFYVRKNITEKDTEMILPIVDYQNSEDDNIKQALSAQRFGDSTWLTRSQRQNLGETDSRATWKVEPIDRAAIGEAIKVVTCFYEDKTEWGKPVRWIYGSITEDIVTGYGVLPGRWTSFSQGIMFFLLAEE
ncbi:cellulose synthase-like protein D5 [Tanacetum coccineum]|uniref:Cellulose synthase-like protein D5 n=1 Tax=Tanacetum coccineum TaxID=301880 RepID=A0ABQ5GKQ6_9ASTR